MYIKTERNGIINPHHYDRIDVHAETSGSYTLRAYTNPIPESIDAESLIIAVYDKKLDADYTLLQYFKSLTLDEQTWNPSTVERFSDLWEKVVEQATKDCGYEFPETIEVEVLDVNKFSLTHLPKYHKNFQRLENMKNVVEDGIREVFGENTVVNWKHSAPRK